jgi:hypothetical protein
VAPQTNGTAGQALIAAAGAGAPVWSTDFQAQNLTTSGNYIGTGAGSFLALGSTVASTGIIRWGSGNSSIVALDSTGTVDFQVIGYASTTQNLTLGPAGGTGIATFGVLAVTVNIRSTGTTTLQATSGVNLTSPFIKFDATISTPVIGQLPNAAASGVGQLLTINAQDAQGLNGTGGAFTIRAGDATGGGTSVGGQLLLAAGDGVTKGAMQFNLGSTAFATWNVASGANFNANNITTTGVIIQGTTPSGVGDYRTKHNWTMKGRNAGNTANVGILDWGNTTNNILILGDRAQPNLVITSSLYQICFVAVVDVQYTSSVMDIKTTVANYSITHGGQSVIGLVGATTVRNMSFFTAAPSFQSGDRCLFLTDRTAAPTGNPTGGFYQWSETGGLPSWRNAAGDVITWTLTSAAAAAAGAGALTPATVSEFMTINYKGNVRKIALYAN